MCTLSKLSLFILSLFLLSIIVIAFHHHDDGGCEHPDCPICVAWHHLPTANFNSALIVVYKHISIYDAPEKLQLFTSLFPAFISSRAPPA